jgi:hypothetical protein
MSPFKIAAPRHLALGATRCSAWYGPATSGGYHDHRNLDVGEAKLPWHERGNISKWPITAFVALQYFWSILEQERTLRGLVARRAPGGMTALQSREAQGQRIATKYFSKSPPAVARLVQRR